MDSASGFPFTSQLGPLNMAMNPNPQCYLVLGRVFNSEGKGYEGIIIAFFLLLVLIETHL